MAKNLALPASLATSRSDASFHQGEDVTLTVTLASAANITGWSLAFTIKKQYGDAAAILPKTTGSGSPSPTPPTASSRSPSPAPTAPAWKPVPMSSTSSGPTPATAPC
jgi:hypothetical protein